MVSGRRKAVRSLALTISGPQVSLKMAQRANFPSVFSSLIRGPVRECKTGLIFQLRPAVTGKSRVCRASDVLHGSMGSKSYPNAPSLLAHVAFDGNLSRVFRPRAGCRHGRH